MNKLLNAVTNDYERLGSTEANNTLVPFWSVIAVSPQLGVYEHRKMSLEQAINGLQVQSDPDIRGSAICGPCVFAVHTM